MWQPITEGGIHTLPICITSICDDTFWIVVLINHSKFKSVEARLKRSIHCFEDILKLLVIWHSFRCLAKDLKAQGHATPQPIKIIHTCFFFLLAARQPLYAYAPSTRVGHLNISPVKSSWVNSICIRIYLDLRSLYS